MEPMTIPMTNREIENLALAFVIAQEALDGRAATDTRGRGAAGDLISAERVIEVKAFGTSARGADLWLEVRQVEEGRTNPNFYVYVVENIRQGDPAAYRLLEVGGDDLQRLLAHAREKHYYEVPFPVAVYDRLSKEP
jgi:hypothetical protein